jgi:hypothetical protein
MVGKGLVAKAPGKSGKSEYWAVKSPDLPEAHATDTTK